VSPAATNLLAAIAMLAPIAAYTAAFDSTLVPSRAAQCRLFAGEAARAPPSSARAARPIDPPTRSGAPPGPAATALASGRRLPLPTAAALGRARGPAFAHSSRLAFSAHRCAGRVATPQSAAPDGSQIAPPLTLAFAFRSGTSRWHLALRLQGRTGPCGYALQALVH
jgi:hypothetical protein